MDGPCHLISSILSHLVMEVLFCEKNIGIIFIWYRFHPSLYLFIFIVIEHIRLLLHIKA